MHSSALPILHVGAGYALSFSALRHKPKGTERRAAQRLGSCLAAASLWREARAGRRSIAAFSRRTFRPPTGPQVRASWDEASMAVSHLEPVPVQPAPGTAVVMPPGRVPGPPESSLARRSRGRRIRSHRYERLMTAPFDGPDELHIVLSRNVVKRRLPENSPLSSPGLSR
jgi:hypothetical protein